MQAAGSDMTSELQAIGIQHSIDVTGQYWGARTKVVRDKIGVGYVYCVPL